MKSSAADITEIQRLIAEVIERQACLLLVLSRPRASSTQEFTKVSVRPVSLKRGAAYQFTFHSLRKETHENFVEESAANRCVQLLNDSFEHAHLFTPSADYEIRARSDGTFQRKQSPPSKSVVAMSHNREKQYLLPEGEPIPFLVEIGVMNRTGKVLAAKYHKFRQINRFLELVDDALVGLPRDRELRVLDFGSGKSYLTFALHHLLTGIRKFQARITGIDRNAEVIEDCARIAERLDCRGLDFRAGDIGSFPVPDGVDLVVSLHACDTATDDVLASAILANCPVILAVPCCQHEFAAKMHVAALAPLEKHGILVERFAALATDALRAELLELYGYRTQIVEFIDLEHTAKNLLIRAVRPQHHAKRQADPALEQIQNYEKFKQTLGIERPYLEQALGASFTSLLAVPPANADSPSRVRCADQASCPSHPNELPSPSSSPEKTSAAP